MADPEGNEFCVIEETNNWLAGTGFLGELAADGTREVGVFWAGRPRLAAGPRRGRRDRDLSRRRVGSRSPWGGPPLNEYVGRHRMHFVLVRRRISRPRSSGSSALGASVVGRDGDDVEMADPGGNEFHLRAG